jgi:hypothetical protein
VRDSSNDPRYGALNHVGQGSPAGERRCTQRAQHDRRRSRGLHDRRSGRSIESGAHESTVVHGVSQRADVKAARLMRRAGARKDCAMLAGTRTSTPPRERDERGQRGGAAARVRGEARAPNDARRDRRHDAGPEKQTKKNAQTRKPQREHFQPFARSYARTLVRRCARTRRHTSVRACVMENRRAKRARMPHKPMQKVALMLETILSDA